MITTACGKYLSGVYKTRQKMIYRVKKVVLLQSAGFAVPLHLEDHSVNVSALVVLLDL